MSPKDTIRDHPSSTSPERASATDGEPPRGPALVTGAAGFLGRHLVAELLRRGRQVVALDLDLTPLEHHLRDNNLAPSQDNNLAPSLDQDNNLAPSQDNNLAPSHRSSLRMISGDLTEAKIRRQALVGESSSCNTTSSIGTIFHLAAAHLGVRLSETEFRRVNVEATRAIAREALAAGVTRFIHTSSVGVYGELAEPPGDEDSPCRPDLPYERTKLEGEQVIRRLVEEGLPAVILRPVWVYGPGCPRTAKLLRAISRRRFVIAGSGRTMRHCLHIDDMTTAFLLAECREAAVGRVIVVGDDRPVTVAELCSTIAEVVGAPPPPRVPYGLLWVAAIAAEGAGRLLGREPPLSRRTLKLFTNNTAFRTDRSRHLLGLTPRHTLRSGLEATWRGDVS